MTTNYHTPLSGVDVLDTITLNSRFSDLDSAITDLQDSTGTVSVTLGEGVAATDAGYIDLSDGQGYLLDADAATPKAGAVRGFWTATALSGATGTLQISGLMSGFTGLTVGEPVYVATTAGDITQTRPAPSSGGAQVAIMQLGIAVSATEVLVRPQPVQYQKRDALADTDTLTITHHDDANGYRRGVWAYVTETTAGAEAEGYASGNQDSDVDLRGPTLAGDTESHSSTATNLSINDSSIRAQSFQLSASGKLSQITFGLAANSGSPSGDIEWELQTDNAGEPSGTVLDSGTITPTPSATNTINISSGPTLILSTTYWIVLKAPSASSGSYQWYASTSNAYANGQRAQSVDSEASWVTATTDHEFSVTADAVPTKDKLAQTFTLSGSTDIASVGLWLKKVGSPTGTATVRIETVSGGNPTGTLANVAATVTFAESGLGTSYAEELVTFASEFTLAAGTYAIVLSTDRAASATNYIQWGADGSAPSYAGGEMKSETSSVWSAESKDAVFSVYEPGVTFSSRVSAEWWSSTYGDMVQRYDDGAGNNPSTQTTFKCVRASGFSDATVVVELP